MQRLLRFPKQTKIITQNYRPISLLSALSKIFEKLILKRIILHINLNNIIPEFQFGFRAGHSTSHQLLRVSRKIKSELINKKSNGMAILDVEKAFDSVWHHG